MLVTGHFGQWEAGRAWMKSAGINCAGVYRPLDDRALNALYLASLEFGGTPIFAKGARGVRGIVAHLTRGGIVAILTDQYERRAAPLDFLGRPAPTSTVAAELALKYKLPLVPIYGIRDPDGAHVAVVVEAPIPHTAAPGDDAGRQRQPRRPNPRPSRPVLLAAPALGEAHATGRGAER